MADSYNELFGLGTHSEDSSLEGWWKLQDDAANTTIVDETGNSNGTLNGGSDTEDLTAAGPNNYLPAAIGFDGTATIDCNSNCNLSGSGVGTILAWCYRSSSTQLNFGSFTASSNRFAALWNTSGTLYAVKDSKFPNLSKNETGWHHIAVRHDKDASPRGDLFYDGSKQSLSGTDFDANNFATTTNVDIGDGQVVNSNNTRHAGVSVFTRALTDSEISDVYSGPEPLNTVAPSLSGIETEGDTLSSTTGTWDGQDNGTVTQSYQWTRSDNGSGLNEADIGAATSSTYTLVAADVGKYIRCRVRGTGDGGYDSAEDTNSGFTGAIAASGGGATTRRYGMLLRGVS